jgi:integrase
MQHQPGPAASDQQRKPAPRAHAAPATPNRKKKEPERRTLTDRLLQSLKRSEFKQRRIVYDEAVRGFGVHVLKSQLSFVVIARAPGRTNPTRMALGEYAPLTPAEQKAAEQRYKALPAAERAALGLEEYLLQTYGPTTLLGAREKARRWIRALKAGTDPRAVEARERAAAQAAAGKTFGAVAERFIAAELPRQRQGARVARVIRVELLPAWERRPVADITHRDVRELIGRVVERGARTFAHNVLDAARAVFNYAVARGDLDVSPCITLKPSKVIGAKAVRTRTLDDNELRLVWGASLQLGYPYGPLIRGLLLCGTRLGEMSDARWPEFDLDKRLWTIPAARAKSGVPHVIPLTDDMLALLKDLPRWTRGDHLFSSNFGLTGVASPARAKERMDKLVGFGDWVFHDTRRVVRTRLAELRVADFVAEMVIGHSSRGKLAKVYDQFHYLPQLREALELWHARLRAIVSPPPDNVVALPSKRRSKAAAS